MNYKIYVKTLNEIIMNTLPNTKRPIGLNSQIGPHEWLTETISTSCTNEKIIIQNNQ